MKNPFPAAVSLFALALAVTASSVAAQPADSRGGAEQLRTGIVTCAAPRLFVFRRGDNRGTPAEAETARQGQRIRIISGPRTTLSSNQFYETSIRINELGRDLIPHYFISERCVSIER